jgi:hypothetical protein
VKRTTFGIFSACAALIVCVASLMTSCKSWSPGAPASIAAKDLPAGARQWRLEKETIGADSEQDYSAGLAALRSLDAFGTMETSKLFYHHQLQMVPAGTLVADIGSDVKGATKVRVLDGPESGQTLWLYPESAEKMGFPAPSPAR